MERQEILEVLYEWQNLILQTEGIERSYEKEIITTIGSKPIKIITGFRRSGKSFLVLRILKELIRQKSIKLENILYLNFEDLRLSEINTAKKLNKVYQIFLSTVAKEGDKIIVLDEVQNIQDWDKFVRTIYEKKSISNEIEIILTGSNSELLSSELGSNLAGRFIEFFILPFSFSEYLRYSKLNIKSESDYNRHQNKIRSLFYEYIKYGGLPEHFSITTEKAKYSYLEGIINKVILDDIIKRFSVKNTFLIEKILYYVTSNIGNIISYSRVKGYIKNLGLEIKQDTIVNYIEYLLKSFALFEVSKFDWKSKRIFAGSKKYYSIDPGMVNLYKGLSNNFSKQLENLVYIELKRRDEVKNIHYASNGKEIDFITETKKDIFNKYQICQELTNTNKDRELKAFSIVDKYLHKGENTLITLEDYEEKLNFNGVKINKRNLIKYLTLS